MALPDPIVASPSAGIPESVERAAGNVAAVAGLAAGMGAIAASSCCVVPLTLASLGAGAGIFSGLEALAPWQIPLLVASSAGMAAGWLAWWRSGRQACEAGSACAGYRRSSASLALLLLASLIVLTALGWDYLEPSLLKFTGLA